MKFYLIEVIEYNDGTKDSPAIYMYETLDAAISKFHKELGGWMAKPETKHILCMVVNSEGGVYKNEAWTNPVIPEVPVEETTEEA